MMIARLLLTLAIFQQTATTGLPSPQLNGVGSPSVATPIAYTCNVSLSNVLYIQTNAKPGSRFWLCTNSSGSFLWENQVGAISTAISGTFASQSFLVGGCTSILTVNMPGAVVNQNAATASPIYATAPATANPGLLNLSAWVSAADTVSVQGCAVGILATTPAFTARVLLY